MKLASYKDGSRDGHLVVVSRDLASAHYATGVATRLQQVLDDWNFLSPQLEELSRQLNQGKLRHAFAFDPSMCMAPLPRAFHWQVGSAYAPRAETAPASEGDSALAPAGPRPGDTLLGARDPLPSVVGHRLDLEPQLVVALGDVPPGASAAQALDGVRLVMLAAEVALHADDSEDTDRVPRPATLFAPVAVTPDELGAAWHDGRLALPLECSVNGRRSARIPLDTGMATPFGELVAALAHHRPLRAGALIGSGGVVAAGAGDGAASRLAQRALERRDAGNATSPFLGAGDAWRAEVRDADGTSVFGSIEPWFGSL